jgi:hypothetical protein
MIQSSVYATEFFHGDGMNWSWSSKGHLLIMNRELEGNHWHPSYIVGEAGSKFEGWTATAFHPSHSQDAQMEARGQRIGEGAVGRSLVTVTLRHTSMLCRSIAWINHVCDNLSYSNHESAKRCCEQCPRTIPRGQLDGGMEVPDTLVYRRSARVLYVHHDSVTIIRSTETRKGDYTIMLWSGYFCRGVPSPLACGIFSHKWDDRGSKWQ